MKQPVDEDKLLKEFEQLLAKTLSNPHLSGNNKWAISKYREKIAILKQRKRERESGKEKELVT